MLNSEYNAMLEWEQRGHVLAGIIENVYSEEKLMADILDIAGDFLEVSKKTGIVLYDHWIMRNPKTYRYEVYYLPGKECSICLEPTRFGGGSSGKTFINQY